MKALAKIHGGKYSSPVVGYIAESSFRSGVTAYRDSIKEELFLLRRSIVAADPTGYDTLVKDLKKQIDGIIKKLK